MGRTLCILVFSGLLMAEAAMAYTPTLTSVGIPVKWKAGPALQLLGNPTNTSGLSDGEVSQAVTRSLQRWKDASDNRVSFDYWQGADSKSYVSNNTYNGTSNFFFASSASGANTGLSPSVLGLTQVWYNTETGEILETDIVLNDKDFKFTTDVKATLGYGTIGNQRATYRDSVYIENVLTHELGHAMGMSHSGGLQSTMLFMEAPEQSHLGCDDQIGIRAVYPASDASERGAIEGVVKDDRGGVVFGAQVVAISRRRGVVLASALSNKSGKYRIEALEPGEYVLMVEPFFAGSSALPAYYSSMTSRSCKGGQLGRSFLVDTTTGIPQRVAVTAGGSAAAPDVAFRCTTDGGASVTENSAARVATTAPEIFNAASHSHGFAMVDAFDANAVAQYRLKSLSGSVEIRALSYSLYSPVQPVLALVDSKGNEVSTIKRTPVYTGDSGYMNLDYSLTVAHLPLGDYTLKIMTTAVSMDAYPAGPYQIDTTPFMLVVGSVNEADPVMADTIPFDARCRRDENFAAYVSSGNPPTQDSSATKGIGTCGSLAIASSDGDGSGGGDSGASASAIAGWFAPWIFMALIPLFQSCLLARRRLKWMVCQPLT